MLNTFEVQVGSFRGPLELILELVEQRKMLVNDIALAAVADNFVAHMQTMAPRPLEATAQFLVVATTLLLIKSRSLLPNVALTRDEEQSIEELEAHLQIYQKVKEQTARLRKFSQAKRMYLGAAHPKKSIVFRPPLEQSNTVRKFNLTTLHTLMLRLVAEMPHFRSPATATIQKVVSMEVMMANILGRLQSRLSFCLKGNNANSNARDTKAERLNIIVNFLALLELARRGTIALRQVDHFHDIEIEAQNFGTPCYT